MGKDVHITIWGQVSTQEDAIEIKEISEISAISMRIRRLAREGVVSKAVEKD